MNRLKIAGAACAGLFAFFAALFLLVIMVSWQIPWAQLARLAMAHAEASGIRVQAAEVEASGAGVRLEQVVLKTSDDRLIEQFSSLVFQVRLLPLLTGRVAAGTEAETAGGGRVAIEGGYRFGTVDFDLRSKGWRPAMLSLPLEKFGGRITMPIDMSIAARFPLDAPETVTGSLELRAGPVQVVGGPILAGFGLSALNIVAIKGKQKIVSGKIEGLDLLVDGEQIWGHVDLSLVLRKPTAASSYVVTPRFKVNQEINDKLRPVLPMTGLALDGKGFYTRTLRGTFSKL